MSTMPTSPHFKSMPVIHTSILVLVLTLCVFVLNIDHSNGKYCHELSDWLIHFTDHVIVVYLLQVSCVDAMFVITKPVRLMASVSLQQQSIMMARLLILTGNESASLMLMMHPFCFCDPLDTISRREYNDNLGEVKMHVP